MIPKRQKKLLFVGALLLIIAGIYRIIPFWEQLFSSGDEITVNEQKIFTLQKNVEQKKRLAKQKLILNRQLSRFEAKLLHGTTETLAAVTLQNLLYDLVDKLDVDIKSVRVLKTTKSDDERLDMYTVIAIQARMELGIHQLQQILYGLAKSQNIVKVDALHVQVSKKGKGIITTTLTLSGIMLNNNG